MRGIYTEYCFWTSSLNWTCYSNVSIIIQWQWLISSHRNQTVFLLFEDHRGQEADRTVKIVMWSHRILQFYFSRSHLNQHLSWSFTMPLSQIKLESLQVVAWTFPHCRGKIFLSGRIIFIFLGKPCNLTPDGNWVKNGSQRSKILWFSWAASKNMSHIWWKFYFSCKYTFLVCFYREKHRIIFKEILLSNI